MSDSDRSRNTEIQNPKSKIQNPSDPLADALTWDWGTAYEMLLSLDTLSPPKAHGVPAPWAAGVRKRLTPQSQVALKAFLTPAFGVMAYLPLHLVLEMQPPKTASRFLDFVGAIPDHDFSRRIHLPLVGDSPQIKVLHK